MRNFKRAGAFVVTVLMALTFVCSNFTGLVFAQEDTFAKKKAGEVPGYYALLDEEKEVYEFVNKEKQTAYRVYGTVNGAQEGFYSSDNEGNAVEPFEKIDLSSDEENAGMVFKGTTPAQVPEYYTEPSAKGVYTYKKNDGKDYYRVHGKVNGKNEAFYVSTKDGVLLSPVEVIDQIDDNNSAFGEGVEGKVVNELIDNQAFIDKWDVSRIVDGTKIWDDDDNPGNDSRDDNKIVRTFDKVFYTINYSTELQNQTTPTYFKNGWLYVKFELPYTMAEAKFSVKDMPWLVDAEQKEEDGKIVLTGKRRLKAGDKPSVIPAPDASLVAVVEVRGLKNGDKIEPTFTGWLQGNPEEQYKTVKNDEVKVSAAPSYNVNLERNRRLEWKDDFDFSTGTAEAGNKSEGVVPGRVFGYGVNLELRNWNPDKKLKGIELPKGKITLDLEMKAIKNDNDVTGTGDGKIMPLLWDYKGNSYSQKGNWNRNMYHNENGFLPRADNCAPANKYVDSSNKEFVVTDGGDWKAKQSANIIQVEVDAYELTKDGEYNWPRHPTGATYVKGRGSLGGEEKGRGIFSAGYFQVVFPYERELDVSSLYRLEIEDKNFKATSINDAAVNNAQQIKKDDDFRSVDVLVKTPGNYDKMNWFIKEGQRTNAWGNSLSSGAGNYTADGYSTPGAVVQIGGGISTSNTNDIEDYVYAANILQKFDDEAFQPLDKADGAPSYIFRSDGMKFKLRYAAKAGGNGWDSDSDMNQARQGDLEYFATMADLKAKYPDGVCVAVLIEGRGGKLLFDRSEIYFDVKVLNTAEVGKVYQTTNSVKIWNQENGEKMTFDDTVLSNDPAVQTKVASPDRFIDGTIPKWGPYVKTQYDENGNVVKGHSPYGYTSGASLLIVGVEATITKSVDQKTGAKAKSVYDVSASERRVDYRLEPVVKLAGGKEGTAAETTTVTITDTLPAGVSVTPATKYYYGGTYEVDEDNVNGGEHTGGKELELEDGYPMMNDDGTTTLQWVIEDVMPGENMKDIHFSASIGTPGNENTDVKNLDQLTNKVQIQAVGDGRKIASEFGNVATYNIVVSKLTQSSFNKMILTPLEEIHSDMVYTLDYSNISPNTIINYGLLDVLPANGDGRGTKINGTYATKVTVDLSGATKDDTKLELFYTTKNMIGKKVLDVNMSDFTLGGSIKKGEKKDFDLPAGATAFYVKGTLGGNENCPITIALTPTGNRGGNVYANDATATTDGKKSSYAPVVSGIVVQRKVSGLVWHDENKDGIRQSDEDILAGAKVSIIDEATGAKAKDVRGNEIKSVITKADGKYEFDELSKGKYKVVFESDSLKLSRYYAADVKVGNAKLDSDAEGIYDSSGVLQSAEIGGLDMPEKEKVSLYGYILAYQDLGLYKDAPNEVNVVGTKHLDGQKSDDDITDGLFAFKVREDASNDKTGYSGVPTDEIPVKEDGTILFGNLTFTKEGTYKFILEEINKGQQGYIYDNEDVTMTVVVTRNTDTRQYDAVATFEKGGEGTDEVVFNNKYVPNAATLDPEVQKRITGDKPKKSSVFNFELIAENEETPMPFSAEGTVAKAKVTGAGKANFGTITYEKPGVYNYEVKEVLGDVQGYKYDSKVYNLKVTVKDVSGQLEATKEIENADTDEVIFTNKYTTPIKGLSVKKTSDKMNKTVKPGDKITYKITVKNTGNTELIGIRVRDYVPEYTVFRKAYDGGEYGVINGKEHVTWFIPNLAPGKTKTLRFTVEVEDCVPNNYIIPNAALYEEVGPQDEVSTNDLKDPAHSTNEVRNPTPNSAKTADTTQILLYLVLAVAAAGIGTFLSYKLKKKMV